jgi:PAS domain S-box-containing protein
VQRGRPARQGHPARFARLYEECWLLNSYAENIVRTLSEPLLVLDGEMRVEAANPSFYRDFKITPEQTLGQPIHELGDGQWDNAALRKRLDTLFLTDSDFNDYPIEHDIPGVGRRTMLLNSRRIQLGENKNGMRILLAIEDVTKRRAIERHTETSEVRYRRLFEAAHDGILILSAVTRRITDVNPFLMNLLDFGREHFIGKELWEIGIFGDKAANQRAVQELHDKGSIRFENLPLQDRNGDRHPVEIVANVYQTLDEPVIQCDIRDIADRVRLEREREALLVNEKARRLEAEAANRSKDLFLATVSHEVRTPLSAILAWATLLRGGKCSETDMNEGLEVIERNCKAQAKLIEDLMDISRIVSGKLRLEIGPCKLAEVINTAIEAVRPTANAKGVRIEAALDLAASHGFCDADRMQQVVWNLLSNAVKFTSQGGTVRVTLDQEGSNTRIQVSDAGQGISPDFLPYVFDRFRQADSSARRKSGGLGLGLSIVKQLIELHGGTVHAHSEGEGRGANFTVHLPVHAVVTGE